MIKAAGQSGATARALRSASRATRPVASSPGKGSSSVSYTHLDVYKRQVEVTAEGKTALTRFQPVSLFKAASLLSADILTGRTHQIRVHAAHVGHPLAGDDKYGDSAFNLAMAERWGLRRLFLHAHSVTLALGGREVAVSAPLSPELKMVLDRLATGTAGPAGPAGQGDN